MCSPIFILELADTLILYPTIALYNTMADFLNYFRPYPYEQLEKIQYPEILRPISPNGTPICKKGRI